MTASSPSPDDTSGAERFAPAEAALATLRAVADDLAGVVKTDADARVDDETLSATERAIATGTAMLATSREDAAAALEASIAGAMPRRTNPMARDLLLGVRLVTDGLADALDRARH